MKLPSLEYLAAHAAGSLRRFPLTILSAAVVAALAIYLTETQADVANKFPFINAMLCAMLGISLYFCAAVFSEKKGFSLGIKSALYVLITGVLVLLYFSLPNAEATHNTTQPYIRFAVYAVTAHLLVSFVPFLSERSENGFWNYNKLLFIRFITSVIYSAALFIGLAGALGAVDVLFEADVKPERYFQIWITIALVFNTWFFVSGILRDFGQLNYNTDYPRGLKIFAQYILLPLLVLYLVILYGYGGKIVVLWDWPKGIVSYLIIAVSVLGILTLLLLHPYANSGANNWIRRFSKVYYFLLVPLVVLLFIAISMRLSDYGITINRYIILLLGVWLTVVCAYFIIGRSNIKFIPISLAVMLLLMSFGPWGMFSVSERSQVARLQRILQEAKILSPEGKIINETIWEQDSLPQFYTQRPNQNEALLSDSLHNEVFSIVNYLDEHHGFASIRSWYTQDIDSLLVAANRKKKERWELADEAAIYMRSMGLEYELRYLDKDRDAHFTFNAHRPDATHISGYDYYKEFNLHSYRKENHTQQFSIDSATFAISYSFQPKAPLVITYAGNKAQLALEPLKEKILTARAANNEQNIPVSEMQLLHSAPGYDIKVEIYSAGFEGTGDTIKLNTLYGAIFLKEK